MLYFKKICKWIKYSNKIINLQYNNITPIMIINLSKLLENSYWSIQKDTDFNFLPASKAYSNPFSVKTLK